MTGRDLVTASLELIGAYGSGDSVAASDATDGLASLNRMIDSWSNEDLMIYGITIETALTLTASDGQYTLGTGGDITTRPMSIEAAIIRDDSVSPALDYPLKIISLEEYSAISQKTTESSIPTHLFDDGGYPRRTLYLYPVPSEAKKLVLYTLRPITTISTLDTEISLPQGYEEALVYNLGLRLAPKYGRPVDPFVLETARESKDSIRLKNYRPSYLRCDSAVVGSGPYSIYKGDFRS